MSEKNYSTTFKKVRLETHGFNKSAQSLGDLNSYKSEVDLIVQGKLIDESIDVKDTELRLKNVKSEIVQKESEIQSIESKNEIIASDEIKPLKVKLDDLKNQLQNFSMAQQVGGDVQIGIDNNKFTTTAVPAFNSTKFNSIVFFLIGLSLYLFYYYTSFPFRALFFDWSPSGTGCSLPPALVSISEMVSAIGTHTFLILFPFLFFAFGFALHICIDFKNVFLRGFSLFAIIAITFALDTFIAITIHNETQFLSEQCFGTTPIPWFEDLYVYIYFLLGFVPFFIWGLLYHVAVEENKKKNIPNFLKKLISEKESEIENKENEITKNKKKVIDERAEIQKLRHFLDGDLFKKDELQFSIAQFKAGWIKFTAAAPKNYDQNYMNELNSYTNNVINNIKTYDTNNADDVQT